MEIGFEPERPTPSRARPARGGSQAQRAPVAASPGSTEAGGASRADPTLFTMREAATKLRISRWTLYGLIHRRQLKTIRIGTRRLVPAAAVQALIDRLADEEAA